MAHLRGMGVRMFSALAYAHRPDMAADLNAWTMGSRRRRRVPAVGDVLPGAGGGRVRGRGAGGGGADLQGAPAGGRVPPGDPLLDGVWGLLAEAGVPVVVHAGHAPVGTEHTGPGPFGAVLARYPGLTAIIAHLGAPTTRRSCGWPWTTSGCSGHHDDLHRLLRPPGPVPGGGPAAGSELGIAGKILLGSDFPNIPYPYARQLAGLAGWTWARTGCARSAGTIRWRCSGRLTR